MPAHHSHASPAAAFPFRQRLLVTLIASLSASAPLQAAEEARLRDVVVSATRVEQDVDDVANTVTVIDAERIAREMPTDIKDLLRHETGVSVRALPNRSSAAFYSTGRGGNEGINVRGLEGNQVLLQVDGVRLPMGYSSGPYQAGRGDYIDVEAFKRVEILRGPASTQFGSDGLAGAVSFLTKDPEDLLTLGQPTQTSVKLGYATADRSWSLVPSFAARGENIEGMILASLRRGHETETMGTNGAADKSRTKANPQDTRSDFLMAKLVLKPARGHNVRISAEKLDREIKTDVLTLFGEASYPTTIDVDAREDITRDLLKLDYQYTDADNPWFQRATASLYKQDSKNLQWGYEKRTNTSAWNERTRDTHYAEDVVGGNLQFESVFGDAVSHRLVYGVDASTTEVSSLKEGAQFLNGSLVTSGSSAFVVNKSFPDTDYDLAGAFVQDEIGIGRLSLIPGLRYDRFKLMPRPDAYYTINNATPPATLKDSAVSPKFGMIWKQAPLLNAFAQYAHGFRAPTPTQVNGGVTNLTATAPYTSIGNPNLKPEKSRSVELGIRGRDNRLRYSASLFRNKYEDFILANQQVGGSGTTADPTVFQSINVNDVEISGFEASAEWHFTPDWLILASYAQAKGDERSNGVKKPLATIEPDKLVLGLRYERANDWGGELTVTAAGKKKRNPTATNYTPDGYEVVDLTGWVRLNKHATVNIGAFNLFDKKYHHWSDVRTVSATSTILDAYTQPGRNFSVALKADF